MDEIDLVGAVGREHVGEDGAGEEDEEDDASGGPQRLLAEEPDR